MNYVNTVPTLTVQYTNEKGTKKKIVFENLVNYYFEVNQNSTLCRIITTDMGKDFDNFKATLMTHSVKDFVLTAEGMRHNGETSEDEKYYDLKKAHFNNCFMNYDIEEGSDEIVDVAITFIQAYCDECLCHCEEDE